MNWHDIGLLAELYIILRTLCIDMLWLRKFFHKMRTVLAHFTLYNYSQFERNYLVLMNDQLSDKMNDNNAIIRLMNRFECLDIVEIQFSVPIRSCCL